MRGITRLPDGMMTLQKILRSQYGRLREQRYKPSILLRLGLYSANIVLIVSNLLIVKSIICCKKSEAFQSVSPCPHFNFKVGRGIWIGCCWCIQTAWFKESIIFWMYLVFVACAY